ncbi:MAG: hypothetical protein EZS28_026344 [Streblomastix strix]|uniref:Uncharacterized protein n=1 Tax=Streblomastix strix TaxID=222440 RepID=A0A5J4V5L7_9EUKA|nr:MAG: hypothetical protein EZS28_026344 [Streblomastix strix]
MNQDTSAAQQLPVNIAQQQPVEPELPSQQQINDENAILLFIQGLLNKTARTPEERRYRQQVASAQKLIEQYYDEPAAKLDPPGERASKRTRQQLEDQIDQTIGDKDLEFEAELCKLSVNAQRASAAAITSLAVGDQQSATMWMLVSHHLNRIIAGEAQAKREAALMPDSLKGLVSGASNPVDIFGQKIIGNIKEKAKIPKLMQEHKENESTVSLSPTKQNDQPLVTVPLTMTSKTLNNLEDLILISIKINSKAEVDVTKETAMEIYNSNIVIISSQTNRTTHNQVDHLFKHNIQSRNDSDQRQRRDKKKD